MIIFTGLEAFSNGASMLPQHVSGIYQPLQILQLMFLVFSEYTDSVKCK